MVKNEDRDHKNGGIDNIDFDSAVYSLETIKKAAYRFTDVAAIDIQLNGQTIVCHLHPKNPKTLELQDIANAFRVEVLDQDLRKTIADETSTYRNAILAYAFSNSGVGSSE